ncbi:hypothetical protein CWN50_11885, partial [Klebsiella michiganensis]
MHPVFRRSLAHISKKLRLQSGLSQEAFADKCGLDRTYVSGIER